MSREDDLRAPVEAALRALPLLPVFQTRAMGSMEEFRWAAAVNEVLLMASGSPARLKKAGRQLPSDKPFRPTGRKKAREELDLLAKAADDLIKRTDLHQPAIDALAKQGLTRHSIAAFAKNVATAARQADVSGVPDKVGRGKEADVRFATGLARQLHRHFAILTGRRPTLIVREQDKAGGPYLDLVRAIFTALEIEASPESQARAAISAMKKKVGGKEA